jgi:hypothetical protein
MGERFRNGAFFLSVEMGLVGGLWSPVSSRRGKADVKRLRAKGESISTCPGSPASRLANAASRVPIGLSVSGWPGKADGNRVSAICESIGTGSGSPVAGERRMLKDCARKVKVSAHAQGRQLPVASCQ